MNKILDFVRENKEFDYSIYIREIKNEITRIDLVLSFDTYKLEITYALYYSCIELKIIEYPDGNCLDEFILDNVDFETITEYLLLEQKTDKARQELLNKK